MDLNKYEIEVIKDSVGAPVSNHKGQIIGFIAGLVTNNNNGNVEFIILGSEHLFGWSTRYFGIPVSTERVRVVNDRVSVIVKGLMKQTSQRGSSLSRLSSMLYKLSLR